MGSHPHQGGRRNTPLRGGERGQSKGQDHVCNFWWSSTPPRVRWSSNFLGLPLAGGCSSNCDRKWDHCPSAAEDLGPRREYAARIRAKL